MKLAFLSLPAADYQTSKRFYEVLLRLPIIREHDGGPHRYTDYDLGDARLKLYEWTEPWHAGHFTHFMLVTDALDAVLARVREAGYEARDPEITSWQGRVAAVVDPFGNILNLLDAQQPGSA